MGEEVSERKKEEVMPDDDKKDCKGSSIIAYVQIPFMTVEDAQAALRKITKKIGYVGTVTTIREYEKEEMQ